MPASPTTRRVGDGTTLAIDTTGAGTTFVPLGAITNAGVSGPGAKVDAVDVTFLSETVKVFVPGDLNPGEVSFTLAYDPLDPTTQVLGSQLRLGRSGPFPQWQITFPAVGTVAAATETFTGFVTGLSREAKKNELLSITVTIQVTGDPGYAHS